MADSVALVANGELFDLVAMERQIRQCDAVIAVDGGLRYCEAMGIWPDFIIGDFDSVDSALFEKYRDIPHQIFPVDKDHTDLELGIHKALSMNAQSVILFAALGKRADHTLYNLHLLAKLPGKLRIETESETLYAITDQVVISCTPGQTLSLLPLNEKAEGVNSEGLKWELQEAVINKDFMSISNVALSSKVKISIRKGILLLCLNKGNS